MKYYDQDNSGTLDYEEFVRGMRDDLTDRRLQITKKCFMIMDRDRSGIVNKVDI